MRRVSFDISVLASVCAALLGLGAMLWGLSSSSSSYSYTPEFDALPTEDLSTWEVLQELCAGVRLSTLVMIGLSMTAAWLVLAIGLRYRLATRESKEFEKHIGEALHRGRVEDAVNLPKHYPRSPLAVVLNASLGERVAGDPSGLNPSLHARQRAIIVMTENLRSGLWVLPAIACCLPLIGLYASYDELIGNVWFMRDPNHGLTFWHLRLILGALWWLPWCVSVAIPTIWVHKYLSSRFEGLAIETERMSLALLEQIGSLSFRTRYQTDKLDHATTSELTIPQDEQRPWPSAGLIALNL